VVHQAVIKQVMQEIILAVVVVVDLLILEAAVQVVQVS